MVFSLRTTWRLEWQRAMRRRRLFGLNIVIPLLLVIPIAFGGAPAMHAVAVYTVLFALFGTFGAAIPALRDAEHGLIRRITLTRLDMRGVLLGRAAAGSCIDALQLSPAMIVILVAAKASLFEAMMLALALLISLLFASLFGLAVAAIARSVGEGALFAAVTTLLLLHASGVFRTPVPGSFAARVATIAPYRALHEMLLAVSIGSSLHMSGLWVGPVVMVLVVGIAGTAILRALAGPAA